jgi:hypothetical protein
MRLMTQRCFQHPNAPARTQHRKRCRSMVQHPSVERRGPSAAQACFRMTRRAATRSARSGRALLSASECAGSHGTQHRSWCRLMAQHPSVERRGPSAARACFRMTRDGGYAVRPERPSVAFSIRMRLPARHAASRMVQVDGATSFGGATRSFSGASLLQDDKDGDALAQKGGALAQDDERRNCFARHFGASATPFSLSSRAPAAACLLRAGLLAPAR